MMHAWQDHENHRIRRVEIATGETTTLAGSGSYGYIGDHHGDGDGGSAKFSQPSGVAIDPSGTFALVAVRRPQPYTPHGAIPQTAAHPPCTRRRRAAPVSTTHCAARPLV